MKSLSDALKIDSSKEKLSALEKETSKADFWSDSENSQKILSKIKLLNSKIKSFESIKEDFEEIEVLIEISSEENDETYLDEIKEKLKALKKEIENQTLATLLTGQYDQSNAILTFHAGAGGTESQDWAEMLLRMYSRWADRKSVV